MYLLFQCSEMVIYDKKEKKKKKEKKSRWWCWEFLDCWPIVLQRIIVVIMIIISITITITVTINTIIITITITITIIVISIIIDNRIIYRKLRWFYSIYILQNVSVTLLMLSSLGWLYYGDIRKVIHYYLCFGILYRTIEGLQWDDFGNGQPFLQTFMFYMVSLWADHLPVFEK